MRPGPIQGGAVNPYIERLERLREDPSYEIPYEHPVLEEVLRETLGTIIFQDQVIEVAQAFAGFSPGEAEGLRRAMSRKRSDAAMDTLREDFLGGAQRHLGASRELAERVWAQVAGFAGFGFPRAHAAAFGLLAYQSTWLRVHYGPEFLCALLNEQPMGFYAPDSLIHEAEQRGIPVLRLDVNRSEVPCSVEDGSVRLGLGYIKGARADEMCELVVERERGGPFSDLGELVGRVGAGRVTLEQLAWSGACDELLLEQHAGASSAKALARATARRKALWQLGVVSPGEDLRRRGPLGTQLALPVAAPESPRLRPLSRWQGLMADYATSGVTIGDHVIAALRPRLTAVMITTSPQLSRMPDGCSVTVIGLVIARQRPGTAGGTTFLLFEDEWGTINLIVPKAVYERHRRLARAEPLLLARGRLERMRDVVNVLVSELAPLEDFVSDGIEGRDDRVAVVRRLEDVAPAGAGADAGDRPVPSKAPSWDRACGPWSRPCRASATAGAARGSRLAGASLAGTPRKHSRAASAPALAGTRRACKLRPGDREACETGSGHNAGCAAHQVGPVRYRWNPGGHRRGGRTQLDLGLRAHLRQARGRHRALLGRWDDRSPGGSQHLHQGDRPEPTGEELARLMRSVPVRTPRLRGRVAGLPRSAWCRGRCWGG